MAWRNASIRSIAVGALLCFALSISSVNESYAQTYPQRSVRLIVPGSAGSGADTLGRLMAEGMTPVFAQQVVVDNRAGAGANLGAEIAARSPADGYTLLLINMAHAANVSLYSKLGYDLVKDFSPVVQLASSPNVVVVNPALPVRSMTDLVKLAKDKPGGINYASAGAGTPTFLATELFKGQTGINLVHVPYKGGGPALTSVISGETGVYFAPVASALPHVRQNTLRALAMTTAKRNALMPELPTVAESGFPGYEFVTWYGFLVPAKTPKAVIASIRSASIAALGKPDMVKRLGDLGYITVGDTSEEFGAYIKSEIVKLGKLVHELHLTAETN